MQPQTCKNIFMCVFNVHIYTSRTRTRWGRKFPIGGKCDPAGISMFCLQECGNNFCSQFWPAFCWNCGCVKFVWRCWRTCLRGLGIAGCICLIVVSYMTLLSYFSLNDVTLLSYSSLSCMIPLSYMTLLSYSSISDVTLLSYSSLN